MLRNGLHWNTTLQWAMSRRIVDDDDDDGDGKQSNRINEGKYDKSNFSLKRGIKLELAFWVHFVGR